MSIIRQHFYWLKKLWNLDCWLKTNTQIMSCSAIVSCLFLIAVYVNISTLSDWDRVCYWCHFVINPTAWRVDTRNSSLSRKTPRSRRRSRNPKATTRRPRRKRHWCSRVVSAGSVAIKAGYFYPTDHLWRFFSTKFCIVSMFFLITFHALWTFTEHSSRNELFALHKDVLSI